VFELLTQQYELAKVQEVKEVPSVKILDAAVVPTKKSYPPRLLFTATGTALIFLGACAGILAKQAWNGIDPKAPGKQFAAEVAGTLRAEALRLAPAVSKLWPAWARVLHSGDADGGGEERSARAEPQEVAKLTRAARNSLG
jgi:hypothetical protein